MEGEAWVAGAVPVILALVQLAKVAGFPARWAGFLALGLGALAGLLVYLYGGDAVGKLLFWGLLAGLTASGAYSTAKNGSGR